MKKILVLALAALLLLPVLPTFAIEARTSFNVSDYVDIASDLEITINASEGFEGADIDVAGQVFQSYNGTGAGRHSVMVDLENLFVEGEATVTVTAYYEGGDWDTVSQDVNVARVNKTVVTVDTPAVGTTLGFRALSYSGSYGGSGEALPADNPDYWAIKSYAQIDVTPAINPPLTGIVSYSFDFKCDDLLNHIRVRMTANTSNGAAFIYGAGLIDGDKHTYLIKNSSGFGSENVAYNLGEWNHVELVFDIPNRTYNGYINGILADSSEIDATVGTNDMIVDSRTLIRTATNDSYVYVDNFKFSGYETLESWKCERAVCDDEGIKISFSDEVEGLTKSSFKIVNAMGNEIAISAVNYADGEYVIKPATDLLYGGKYTVLLKNGIKSKNEYVAYKEPLKDKNGDGFWALASVSVPKYSLNIDRVEEISGGANVYFNNTDIFDKWAAVCWYNEDGALVDFAIQAATEVYHGEYISFSRNNAVAADKFKVYVFAFNTNAESTDFGAVDVIDIFEQ